MLELTDWIASRRFPDKPWLILGKGPTFARRDEFPIGDFNLLGLNNVVGEMRVDVAHIIDVDVLDKVADKLADHCQVLLMPRRPHVSFLASERMLEDFFDEYPVLRRLDDEQRLVWYNARTGSPVGKSPVIRVRSFSSEAALDILGEMRVETVRTLGVDGGSRLSKEFEGLPTLGAGLPTYDAQFRELEDIVRVHGMDFDPLVEPLKVFVGTDETQMVATRVLEHTIRRHATGPVRVVPMLNLPTPKPKDPANRGRTGFSFSRFHIPQLAGYRGKALYMDADMQVFGDISELQSLEFADDQKVIVTRQDEPPPAWKDNDWFHPGRQMSVMLLDCRGLSWEIDEIVAGMDRGRYAYSDLLFDLCVVPEAEVGEHMPAEWNHLEHYEEGQTKNLHYTVVPSQPWKNDLNPLHSLWDGAFEEARESGILYPSDIRRAVRAGYLKRSVVGRPPASKPQKAIGRIATKVEAALLDAEQRIPVLRRNGVARLRSRLNLI